MKFKLNKNKIDKFGYNPNEFEHLTTAWAWEHSIGLESGFIGQRWKCEYDMDQSINDHLNLQKPPLEFHQIRISWVAIQHFSDLFSCINFKVEDPKWLKRLLSIENVPTSQTTLLRMVSKDSVTFEWIWKNLNEMRNSEHVEKSQKYPSLGGNLKNFFHPWLSNSWFLVSNVVD